VIDGSLALQLPINSTRNSVATASNTNASWVAHGKTVVEIDTNPWKYTSSELPTNRSGCDNHVLALSVGTTGALHVLGSDGISLGVFDKRPRRKWIRQPGAFSPAGLLEGDFLLGASTASLDHLGAWAVLAAANQSSTEWQHMSGSPPVNSLGSFDFE
jgi:hypothetical protein